MFKWEPADLCVCCFSLLFQDTLSPMGMAGMRMTPNSPSGSDKSEESLNSGREWRQPTQQRLTQAADRHITLHLNGAAELPPHHVASDSD